jgi:hypothetical protein
VSTRFAPEVDADVVLATSPTGTRSAPRARPRVAVCGMVLVFAVTAFVYWISPVREESDSFWTISTARSLVRDGDVALDEHDALIRANRSFQIEHRDGHAYYAVPLGTSLTALPVVVVASLVDGSALDRDLTHGDNQPWDGISAALLAALTAAVMFAVAQRLTVRPWVAYATAFTFAFGTQAWGIASRTTWMQGPSMLCLAGALYFALRARESEAWFGALGAVLAVGYFVRPTNAVAVAVFGVWALLTSRRAAFRFAASAAAVAVVFVALNELLYGLVLQPYFRASRLALTGSAIEALAANVVSPNRGLLVFVPASVLAAFGLRARIRAGSVTSLECCVAITVVLYWLGVSCFPDWTGGWSYGPRLLADVAPLLAFFLPAAFEAVVAKRSRLVWALTVLVVLGSVGIQFRGAFERSTAEWNWTPRYLDPARVWDWGDPQFLA